MKRLLVITTAVAAFAASPRGGADDDATRIAEAKRDFLEIAKVLRSPRCQNCHPAGDAPLQTDAGTRHTMGVTRRSPKVGLPCTTCHREKNASLPGGPPGVAGWHMPPDDTPMVFEGRTPTELCEQLKDLGRNGGRGLAEIEEHLAHDPLVLWGWDPGPGRTRPPIAHAKFVEHARRWIARGAPCP
jgi:hypothetical protein